MRTTGILTLIGVASALPSAFTTAAGGLPGNPLLLSLGIAGLGSLAALSERWRAAGRPAGRRETTSPLPAAGHE